MYDNHEKEVIALARVIAELQSKLKDKDFEIHVLKSQLEKAKNSEGEKTQEVAFDAF